MTETVTALDIDRDQPSVWVGIPPGYFSIPLDDIDGNLQRAETVLTEVADDVQRKQVHALVGVLGVFLRDLVTSSAAYCGIGRHVSARDGTPVTSTLVVSYQEYQGSRNPRVLLGDLVQAKANAGERGQTEVVELADGPALFFQRTRKMPSPRFPGQPEVSEGATTPVYQVEVLVPSEDGSKLATIDFSTAFTAYGPEFDAMLVQIAQSVSFERPAVSPESSRRIQQLLG